MADHGATQGDDDEGISVRPYAPADRAEVERLLTQGLLPGHVDYESREAERIRGSFGSERERFLVAEAGGRVVGTVAVVEGSPDVAHLYWLRVEPEWQPRFTVARRLSLAAAAHAREVGLLKLVVQAPADAEQRVASYYHELGFEFSRSREIDGRHVLEFYLNLYERPQRREAP
jgi:N-acetylglutamate synthase-like GNAT family acetyltransferase